MKLVMKRGHFVVCVIVYECVFVCVSVCVFVCFLNVSVFFNVCTNL